MSREHYPSCSHMSLGPCIRFGHFWGLILLISGWATTSTFAQHQQWGGHRSDASEQEMDKAPWPGEEPGFPGARGMRGSGSAEAPFPDRRSSPNDAGTYGKAGSIPQYRFTPPGTLRGYPAYPPAGFGPQGYGSYQHPAHSGFQYLQPPHPWPQQWPRSSARDRPWSMSVPWPSW